MYWRYGVRAVKQYLPEAAIIPLVSIATVVAGAAAAAFAAHVPAHVEAIETGAGVLLLGGFALLGFALPALL
ncbi:MAG: hypothetical protein QOF09_3411 [Alphaproteobacteria bacterium]|jgi:hypothetical protein|nr:hypothetical protein [Alphaproteobacteria bacterium]